MRRRPQLPFAPATSEPEARPDRRALGGWTLRRLYEGIFSGEFAPGQTVTEAELTELLGVSRQPVRDALRELEREGLVEPAQGKGQRVVVAFTRDHVEELYAVRAALESVSFHGAATRIDEPTLDELRGMLEELERREHHRAEQGATYDPTLDFRFHQVVCLTTGMRTLYAHLSIVWTQTWALLTQLDLAGTYPSTEDALASYADRWTLVTELERRDPDAAARSAQEHVYHRRDQLLAAIDDGRGTFRFQRTSTPHPNAGKFV